MPLPLLIAHRGGKFWESDDFSYVSDSIRAGADFIELDVRSRDGKYLIQHEPYEKEQGWLADALPRLEHAGIYLDVKDVPDVNELIAYVRERMSGPVVVGSFNLHTLKAIRDPAVIRNVHCWWEGSVLARAKAAGAQWINPMPYLVTQKFAQDIKDAGFKFMPGGNQVFKEHEILRDQIRFASWGAYALSTHHVARLRNALITLSDL